VLRGSRRRLKLYLREGVLDRAQRTRLGDQIYVLRGTRLSQGSLEKACEAETARARPTTSVRPNRASVIKKRGTGGGDLPKNAHGKERPRKQKPNHDPRKVGCITESASSEILLKGGKAGVKGTQMQYERGKQFEVERIGVQPWKNPTRGDYERRRRETEGLTRLRTPKGGEGRRQFALVEREDLESLREKRSLAAQQGARLSRSQTRELPGLPIVRPLADSKL